MKKIVFTTAAVIGIMAFALTGCSGGANSEAAAPAQAEAAESTAAAAPADVNKAPSAGSELPQPKPHADEPALDAGDADEGTLICIHDVKSTADGIIVTGTTAVFVDEGGAYTDAYGYQELGAISLKLADNADIDYSADYGPATTKVTAAELAEIYRTGGEYGIYEAPYMATIDAGVITALEFVYIS